jgi:hypothetical protein
MARRDRLPRRVAGAAQQAENRPAIAARTLREG